MDEALADELDGAYAGRRDIDPTWKLVDLLSVEDAAALAAGFDPTVVRRCQSDTYFDRYFGSCQVMLEALQSAITSRSLPAEIAGNQNSHETDWGRTKVKRSDLVVWLRSKDVESGHFAKEIEAAGAKLRPVRVIAASHLQHWDAALKFTGQQAASLITGIDPAHPNNEWWKREPALRRLEEAYDAARFVVGTESKMEHPDLRRALATGTPLPSLEMLSVIGLLQQGESETLWLTMERWLNGQSSSFRDQNFSREVLHRWIEASGIASAYDFSAHDALVPAPAVAEKASAITAAPGTAELLKRRPADQFAFVAEHFVDGEAVVAAVGAQEGLTELQTARWFLRYIAELDALPMYDFNATDRDFRQSEAKWAQDVFHSIVNRDGFATWDPDGDDDQQGGYLGGWLDDDLRTFFARVGVVYPAAEIAKFLSSPRPVREPRPPTGEAGGDPAAPQSAGVWPWGNHSTRNLQLLRAAAEKWWKNYDPSDPGTAPTNNDVEQWLRAKYKVSENMAKAIASMLRADDLPTGPRR